MSDFSTSSSVRGGARMSLPRIVTLNTDRDRSHPGDQPLPASNAVGHPARKVNKKREKASPKQLDALEAVFKVNATPTTETRIQLGQKIGMTSRSVQIWFQNQRQKRKHASKSTQAEAKLGSGTQNAIESVENASTSLVPALGPEPPKHHRNANTAAYQAITANHDNCRYVSTVLCFSLRIGNWCQSELQTSLQIDNTMELLFWTVEAKGRLYRAVVAFEFIIEADVTMTASSVSGMDFARMSLSLSQPPYFFVRDIGLSLVEGTAWTTGSAWPGSFQGHQSLSFEGRYEVLHLLLGVIEGFRHGRAGAHRQPELPQDLCSSNPHFQTEHRTYNSYPGVEGQPNLARRYTQQYPPQLPAQFQHALYPMTSMSPPRPHQGQAFYAPPHVSNYHTGYHDVSGNYPF